jgi:general stress protein 26
MTDTSTHTDERAAISDIVHGARTALLTTVSSDGSLHARPLAVQDKTFTGTLRFLVQDGSEKVEDIAANPNVNVSIESQGGYLSIAGTAEVTTNEQVIDELWSPFAEAWFPEGRKDPSIRLLTVTGHSVEYWTQDTGPVGSLVQTIKSVLTGSKPDVGSNGTVSM